MTGVQTCALPIFVSSGTSEISKRYGMIGVDADNEGNGTYNRYRKKSFYYYKKLIASNGADTANDTGDQFDI